jgi:glycosyltransferase involved in cell wall biosynthesis
MKIFLLTTHFNTGGITSYILTLAKGLQNRGHVVFIGSSGGNAVKDLRALGIEHLWFNIQTKSELHPKVFFELEKLSRVITAYKIDCIHSHTRVTQVMGTLVAHRQKIAHVTTCHGYFKPRWGRRFFPCWGDAVIAISEPVARHLRQDFHVPGNKVVLVQSGIALDDFPVVTPKQRQESRREFGLGDQPVIGIIARLSDVKGHDILIEAMQHVIKKIPDAKLMIVGEGKKEQDLKNLVHTLELKESVRFYPVVQQTAKILPAFDVFVMPSLQEGLGLSIMEAQAAGLPVAATRVGGIPDLVIDGKTGLLVEPGEADALADAILRILKDKPLASRLGKQARAFAQKELAAGTMVEKIEKVYEKHTRRQR